MTTEQHNAEMAMLHRNQMDGQSKIKNRLKYWAERRDKLIIESKGLDLMNERQRLNYEVIQSTIEDIDFFIQTNTAFATKYQQLYLKQCEFIRKMFSVKLLTEDFKKLRTGTPEQFVENLTQIFDEKAPQ